MIMGNVDKSDVVIIGAGVAGLTAGCYACMNGYKTTIFEHHNKPGGLVTAWKRDGYTIDGGMHMLMGYEEGQPVYELYRDVGVFPGTDVVSVNDFMRFIDVDKNRSITVTRDLDKLADDMKAQSPEDVVVIDELIDGARSMLGSDFGMASLEKAPELMTIADKGRFLWQTRWMGKYVIGKFAQPICEYTQRLQDPWLKKVIDHMFLPQVPVWFVMMILGMLASDQIGLLKMGSLDFSERIAQKFVSLGGKIVYRATVDKIAVKEDKAIGVVLKDGTEHRADHVISAGDGYNTLFGLLDGRYVDADTKKRYDTWPLVRPLIMVNYGLVRSFAEEPPFNLCFMDEPLQAGDMTYDIVTTKTFNYTTSLAPPGRTLFQVILETDWDLWTNIRENIALYEKQKDMTARALLEFLDGQYPGISDQVEMIDVATPYTFWRYTMNHNGAYEGWLPTADKIIETIPRTLPGLKGFYMAGQWVAPGGGVPTSMYTGMHAVQLICAHDSKSWCRKDQA